MVEKVISLKKRHRIAVAWAQDPNTISALSNAVSDGFADAIMIGKADSITDACKKLSVDPEIFTIINSPDESKASAEAVRLARSGEADVVMKGLVGTDKFLKAVMDKEAGLMLPGAVLSYV